MKKHKQIDPLDAKIKFLERTKDGRYCEIDKDQIYPQRLHQENYSFDTEDGYYYSLNN